MRWFWIDRYTEFEAGRHATAVKAVALSEDHPHDHFKGAPVMPNSLILEGMAQTAGLLIAEQSGFEVDVVLAKVARAVFHFAAVPGDTLTYRAKIENLNRGGAIATITSHIGDRLQAESELFFAHLENETANGSSGRVLFDPPDLYAWLRVLGIFQVGRDAQGRPLPIPSKLTAAHAALAGSGAAN